MSELKRLVLCPFLPSGWEVMGVTLPSSFPGEPDPSLCHSICSLVSGELIKLVCVRLWAGWDACSGCHLPSDNVSWTGRCLRIVSD